MPRPVVTFELAGPLVQWRETLSLSLERLLLRHGADPALTPVVLTKFLQEQRRLWAAPLFRPERDILALSLRAAFQQQRLPENGQDAAFLAHALSLAPIQPDAPAALRGVCPHARIALIADADDDLLTPGLAALGVPWDMVITAQQARAHRPSPALFRYAQRRLGVQSAGQLHVAQSQGADLRVCQSLEVATVWVNREEEMLRADLSPQAVLLDLRSLPDVVEAWVERTQEEAPG